MPSPFSRWRSAFFGLLRHELISRSYRMQNVQRTFLSPWNPSLRFG